MPAPREPAPGMAAPGDEKPGAVILGEAAAGIVSPGPIISRFPGFLGLPGGTRSPRSTWRAGSTSGLSRISTGAPPGPGLVEIGVVSTIGIEVSAKMWQSIVVMTNP